jgi:hypothetical protein
LKGTGSGLACHNDNEARVGGVAVKARPFFRRGGQAGNHAGLQHTKQPSCELIGKLTASYFNILVIAIWERQWICDNACGSFSLRTNIVRSCDFQIMQKKSKSN